MPSTLAHLVCDLIDVASRVGKVENTQRIVAMALHKALDPLRPILDRTHFLGSLNTAPAHFRDFPDQQTSRRWPCVQST
jgi:hypothetical protein